MEKTKSIERAVLIGLMLSLAPGLLIAATPACWADVSGDIVFDGSMNCRLDSRPDGRVAAIKVVADGTTINLGNHTMKCLDWINQSCQGKVPEGQTEKAIAIDLNGHTNVTILGPGTIDGFDRSIFIDSVGKATVRGVTVTGPQSYGTDRGANTTGIRVANVACPGAILIDGNKIYNHRYGVVLESASCVKIQGNTIEENRAQGGDSHGVLLTNSGGNTITNNFVNKNGLNSAAPDGGITLVGSGSTGNRVASNTVSNNCGDGISTRGGAQGNPISGTYARQNPDLSGTCYNSDVPSAYDMAERAGLGQNTWRKNNDCDTQNDQIPAGVCTATLP